jgi:protein-disulfide isomerase-like protein with CxxC motif
MLRAIKRLLAAQPETPAVPAHERRQLQLAVAVLVHEARRADYAEGDDDESATAERALAETFGLQPHESAALLKEGRARTERDASILGIRWCDTE